MRKYINGLANVSDCHYCGSKGVPTGLLATVGDFVRQGLARAYGNASSVDVRDPRDEDYLNRSFATRVLEDNAGIIEIAREANLARDLLNAFDTEASRQDRVWLEDGDALIAPHRGFYDLYGIDENDYKSAWDAFKSTVIHEMRFFDIGVQRRNLIATISNLFPELGGKLTTSTRVYRARVADEQWPSTPWEFQQALGPAPLHRTKHSRMSPPGISYLYVSGNPDTCMSEIQPNVGNEVWVARFTVLIDIKLLDFTRLPIIKIPSIFSSDYNSALTWAEDFLKDFLAEIGQPPKSNDNLLEYIPTQVLAEYIRAQGYQGIKYNSAQHPGGVNYTLFCSPDPDPASCYKTVRPPFREWLRIEEVNRLLVTGLKLDFSTIWSMLIDPSTLTQPNDCQAVISFFEWDRAKARSNIKKHGVSFEDAMAVFQDPLARIFADEWHSMGEPRKIIIGHLRDQRLVLVVFCEPSEDRIHIISARPATPREKRDYDLHAR